jgi:hypothetical protein
MILRIIFVLFVSGASGVCYLAGFARLMSALLIGFGGLASIFFGLIFVVPEENRGLWFPVYGEGAAWPFFLLAVTLFGMVFLVLGKRRERVAVEKVNSLHVQYIIGGFFAYLFSVFLPTLLWFPSDERRLGVDPSTLELQAFYGTCLYLLGTVAALYLFYKASKGVIDNYPDMMRRVVLALFAILQLDKLPAFVAFLLIYSPETQIVYPSIAAFALVAYLPVSYFLLKLSWQSEVVD